MTARDPLLEALNGQRRHVLAVVEGLDDDALRRPVAPSGWSVVEMLRHLTLGDERYWFHTVTGGVPLDYWPTAPETFDRPDDWYVAEDESPADVVRQYREAIAESDRIIAAAGLDAAPRRPEDWWGAAGLQFPDLRSVVLHVIVDTATHAGHLDVVRELLDGRQHLVL